MPIHSNAVFYLTDEVTKISGFSKQWIYVKYGKYATKGHELGGWAPWDTEKNCRVYINYNQLLFNTNLVRQICEDAKRCGEKHHSKLPCGRKKIHK